MLSGDKIILNSNVYPIFQENDTGKSNQKSYTTECTQVHLNILIHMRIVKIKYSRHTQSDKFLTYLECFQQNANSQDSNRFFS